MLSELLRASRPFSWINTALPFLAVGLWTAHRLSPALLLGGVFFLFPYNLLLYGVNDIYDFESDRLNPRKGGNIEGGVLIPGHARRLGLALAFSAFPLVLAVSILTPIGGLALVATSMVALLYSAPPVRAKEIPGLDAFIASLAFVLPAVTGGLIAGGALAGLPWLYLLAFLLWGMASQALGAIQDVPYDRRAHINSIAVTLGERPTALLTAGAYLLSIVLIANQGGASLIAATAIVPYLLLALVCVVGEPRRWARLAWKGFLALNLVSGFVITILLLETGAVRLLPEVP